MRIWTVDVSHQREENFFHVLWIHVVSVSSSSRIAILVIDLKAQMRSIDHHLMEESADTSSSSSHYFSIFTNYPLISAVLAFTIAQLIKFFTTWYVYDFTCTYHPYIFVLLFLLLFLFFLFIDYLILLLMVYTEIERFELNNVCKFCEGIRKIDGIWNGLLGLEECLLHIRQQLQL